jgi:hypothetical protein
MRYIEFQRFLIMAQHIHRNIVLGNFCHGRVHSRPFAARATIDAASDGRKQLFRPIAQGLLDDSVSFRLPQFCARCSPTRHQPVSAAQGEVVSNRIHQAVKAKIAALKAEASKVRNDLIAEEKATSRMRCLQAELAAKLSRSAAKRVELQARIALLYEAIRDEEAEES